MARIGNKYPRYAIFDTTTKKYGGAKRLEKKYLAKSLDFSKCRALC